MNIVNGYPRIVGNSPSVSQSPTLDRKDKVKHYIIIKTHNNIALRFWCKTGVKCLISVILMSYNSYITKPYEKKKYKPNNGIRADDSE